MFTRTLSASAAVVMFCAGAVLAASPANAAVTQFRIMFKGSTIPAYVKSVQVDLLDGKFRCVQNVVPGKDLNTGIIKSVADGSAPGSEDRKVWVVNFTNGQCAYPSAGGLYREAPTAAQSGINNWWVALS